MSSNTIAYHHSRCVVYTFLPEIRIVTIILLFQSQARTSGEMPTNLDGYFVDYDFMQQHGFPNPHGSLYFQRIPNG